MNIVFRQIKRERMSSGGHPEDTLGIIFQRVPKSVFLCVLLGFLFNVPSKVSSNISSGVL